MRARIVAIAVAVAAAPSPARAEIAAEAPPAQPQSVMEWIRKTDPIIDYRLRYEFVDQDAIPNHAQAVTSRLRAGIETAPLFDTKLLVEGEWTLALVEHYNDTTNGETWYPTVADPESLELNRFHATNTSIPGTTVTLGRQRVILDDHRFFGNVGFRQNEQTLDALRVDNKSVKNLAMTALYSIQTHRIFGSESAQRSIDGDTAALNIAYTTPFGTVTGFGYWIELESQAALSSQTYGVRFAGKRPLGPVTAHYVASYAYQADAYDNPGSYGAHYFLGEGAVEWKGLRGGLSWEYLGADDGDLAFQTPLATLHKFQGWADKFLTTPGNGVADLYIPLQYVFGDAGMFKKITAQAIYHNFDSAVGDSDYGDEIDLQLLTTVKGVTFSVKYADYFADEFATDTRKVWVAFEYLM